MRPERDARLQRDFRNRPEANGEREARPFAPGEAPEAPILPSFITAPTRVVAPADAMPEPVRAPSEAAAPEAEFPAAAERSRRRRPRPNFEEQAPEPGAILATDAPGDGD